MLISHRYKFIYLKTKKTGGTSIEAYFERFCRPNPNIEITHYCDEFVGDSGIVGYRGENRKGKTWYNHMTAMQIRKLIGESTWKNYFKFSVVRNPWQKAVSGYAFHLHRLDPAGKTYHPTLKDRLKFPAHNTGQLKFLNWLKSGKLPIDRNIYAPKSKLCTDGIIRYEHLERDMQKICQILNIPWAPDKLPTYKSGLRDPSMRAHLLFKKPADSIVREKYKFEIAQFGYTGPESNGNSQQLISIR
jgi:hypothetical protein